MISKERACFMGTKQAQEGLAQPAEKQPGRCARLVSLLSEDETRRCWNLNHYQGSGPVLLVQWQYPIPQMYLKMILGMTPVHCFCFLMRSLMDRVSTRLLLKEWWTITGS